MKKVIAVVGGDLRQKTVLESLVNDNKKAFSVGLSDDDFSVCEIKNADVVVLPIPVSYDGVTVNAPLFDGQIEIDAVLANIKKDALLLGACMMPEFKDKLRNRGVEFYDYYEREELIIKNAIPTAEGALSIALSEMPVTIFGSNVLVIGFGRVGKATARRFLPLGAKVSVSARKCADFAWIEEGGMKAIHTKNIGENIGNFDLIINTVPDMILNKDVLCQVRDDCLIIDLASKPGGVDFVAAKELCKNVIWALSLPGKVAPITSGKIIAETILNILSETGV